MKKNQETPKTMWKAWLTYLALLAFLAFCVMVAQSCMTIDINFNQKQPITNPTDTTAIEAAWY